MPRQQKVYWADDGDKHKGPCNGKKRCIGMRLALARETRGPGLDTALFMNLESGNSTGFRVVYRRAAQDGGILINYCPFCGTDLRDKAEKGLPPPRPSDLLPNGGA